MCILQPPHWCWLLSCGLHHFRTVKSSCFANQKLLYSLLHRYSAETLLELCENKKYLGATPSIIQILHTWRNKLYSTDWNAEIKETFNSNGNAIEYLGRYANRIAITNTRIISVNEKKVSFHAKYYRTNKQNKQLFIFLVSLLLLLHSKEFCTILIFTG